MNNRIVKLLAIVGFLSTANLCAMRVGVDLTSASEARFDACLRSGNLSEAGVLLRHVIEYVKGNAYKNMAKKLLLAYSAQSNYEGMKSFLNFLIEHNAVNDTEAAGWYRRIENADMYKCIEKAIEASSSGASSSTKSPEAKKNERLSDEKIICHAAFLRVFIHSAETALREFPEPEATRTAREMYARVIAYAGQNGLYGTRECQEAQRMLALIQRDGI